MAAARDERLPLERADRWFTANEANFPDSPYGRLMHAAVDLHLSSRGVRQPPDVAPDRLLASFTVDPSGSWLEAADIVLRTWLAAGLRDAVGDALERITASSVTADAFTHAAIDVMRGRVAFAYGDRGTAAHYASAALARLERLPAAWWTAKALRLLERAGTSSAEEVARADAIERRLGAVDQAP